MNDRERIQAALDRRLPDRLPWAPRLELWYTARVRTDTLPERWRGWSLRQIERDLRLGSPGRDAKIMDVRLEGVEVVTERHGLWETTTYHTPVGSVCSVTQHAQMLDDLGLPGRLIEYPLKQPRDYAVWRGIVEHTRYDPAYDAYAAYDAALGEDGYPMASVGDVPLHEWLEKLAGYEYGYLHLADWPQEVERLLGLMAEVQRARLWPVIADGPARFVLHGAHLSTQWTPPRQFERYVLPYYAELMPLLHARGIRVAMHGDNDVSRIIALIERAGWDAVECFVTAPMVPLTLEEARHAWGERVVIWGGLPSTLLSPSVAEGEFHDYVEHMLDVITPGRAFILGVADNVMPDSLIERVAWVTERVEARGWCPMHPRG